MSSIKLKGDTSGEITISAPDVAGTTTLELPATSSTLATQNSLGVRNLIINGDMRIDQRNGGASVTPTNSSLGIDRWQFAVTQASKFTAQQSSDAPTGFSHSMVLTSSSAYSILSGDIFYVRQKIEGFNSAHLEFGTANAKTVTLSFWVKSSLTGNWGGSLQNSAENRSYPFTYTINSANTWEQKTVTISGDTTGTWIGSTNGIGLAVLFGLGNGSTYSGTAGAWASAQAFAPTSAVSLVGTSGATLYITGVQLEVGDTATQFEHRPYDMELRRCQRYFEHNYGTGYAIGSAKSYPNNIGCEINGFTTSNGQKWYSAPYKVNKRAIPSVSIYDANGNINRVSVLDLGGTPTHNVSIGVVFINDTFVCAGASNNTYSGVTYFFTSSAEL